MGQMGRVCIYLKSRKNAIYLNIVFQMHTCNMNSIDDLDLMFDYLVVDPYEMDSLVEDPYQMDSLVEDPGQMLDSLDEDSYQMLDSLEEDL